MVPLLVALVASLVTAPGPAPLPVDRTPPAVLALRQWDDRRAAAYAAGDVAALRSLHTPGCRARRADVSVLRAYDGRGLVVRDLTVQVQEVRVLHRTPGRLRLRVRDRVAGGVVETRAGERVGALPAGQPRWHVLVLERTGRDWRTGCPGR